MNLQSLDNNLRAITPSEQKYRNGDPFDFSSHSNSDIINGEKIINLSKGWTSSRNLVVLKNSRFQPVPLHIHDWIELNYMYSGTCEQTINSETRLLKTGQISLIDTKTPHSIGYTGENDILINLLIQKQYLNTNFFNRLSNDSFISKFFINAINDKTDHDNFIIFHSENSRRVPIFMNEFLCEYFDPSLNSDDMLDSLLVLLISELINVFEKDMNKEQLKTSSNSIIPVLRYIEGNYKTCTLESTAAFFNMNPNYLTTLLKQQTKYSYKELVLLQRMKQASKLLKNTDMPITTIANEVGYENISFFYKKFKEQFGCSPKEYRE